ncbi:MAG: cyclic nucleotide-binding domain-containing protein [Anaerolineales bacterium]|nr:cyclic nucleotide-binding domain-containing protein [Anaerolineales bacterium]
MNTPKMITPAQLEFLLKAEADYTDAPDTAYSSPFLRLLISADRGNLMRSFSERICGPGEIVFQEGEAGDTMYLVWSGRVAIIKGSFDSPTILACKGAGEFIGEMAVIEHQPRSASVIALDKLRLLGLNREGFEHLLQETPMVGLGIMEMLSSRLRQVNEARSSGALSEKQLSYQLSALRDEKQRLENLQRLRQETTDLIIHDLRNPLSSIAVALKMLSFTLPEEIMQVNQEIIDLALTSTERMRRLVETLLEVSRLEEGEAEFTMSSVDLGKMIKEVVHGVSVIDRKGVDLLVDVPLDLPLVTADRDKIERVLTNLMDNALKYAPENGRITWRAERQGEMVQASITDNGPGVPQEERERIFRRFAQAASERPRRRGFGLGLAYCRLTVEHHGGSIWVEEGDEHIGSRFVFTLPVSQDVS